MTDFKVGDKVTYLAKDGARIPVTVTRVDPNSDCPYTIDLDDPMEGLYGNVHIWQINASAWVLEPRQCDA